MCFRCSSSCHALHVGSSSSFGQLNTLSRRLSCLRLLKDQRLAAHAFHAATSLHQPWLFLKLSPSPTTSKTTGLHGLTALCAALLRAIDKTPTIHADARDDDRRTALTWASHGGHLSTVQLLLSRADVDATKTCLRRETALHYAARRGFVSVAQLLIQSAPEIASARNMFEEPPIVRAALEGHMDMVRLLHPHDARGLNTEVVLGLFPIHLAAQRCSAATVRCLVDEFGVDWEVHDPKHYSAFVMAVDWGNEDVIGYFLEEKMEWLMRHGGLELAKAAYLAAASWKRMAVLRMVVEKAPVVLGLLDESGRRPVEVAVAEGNTRAVLYLISRVEVKVF